MEKLMRVMQKSDGIPKKILEVNSGHPLLRSLLRIHRADPENPLLADMILNLFDATMLLDGYLNEPYTLADRTIKLLRESASWYADLRRL